MVRIRYTINDSGTELLSNPSESSLGVLRSQIRRTDSGWSSSVQKLVDSEGGDLWSDVDGTASSTKNLAVAKAKAKRSLKMLGVHFLDEIRRRGSNAV